MHVTYVGISDSRTIDAATLQAAGFESVEDDLVWTQGSTLELDDDLGEWLTERDREFKDRGATTQDLRSKDELLELARLYKIPGRSSMNRDDLLDAVAAHELANAGDSLD